MPVNCGFASQLKSEKVLLPSQKLMMSYIKYKKKYLRYRRFAKNLIFENGALCDEVAQTQAKILRAKEERRFLLRKLMNIEERNDPNLNKSGSPSVAAVSSLDNNSQALLLLNQSKLDPTLRAKKKQSPKKRKEESSVDVNKPKRKRPAGSAKKFVQPMPLDNIGRPVFPINLGELTIHSIGEIISDRPKFHDEKYIYPVGYCSTRMYSSFSDKESRCLYTCKISDGQTGPQFEIAADNSPDHTFTSDSSTKCLSLLINKLNEIRTNCQIDAVCNGPHFFGLSHPMVQNLIQSCQGAKKCLKYNWIKFEIARPQKQAPILDTEPEISQNNLPRSGKVLPPILTKVEDLHGSFLKKKPL